MQYTDLDVKTLSQFVDYDGHETVRRFHDPETGLTAFIAVHNTNMGPALGGCRMFPYASENDAIRDVLRLSRGMTYKNAMAGLPLGGGKSVIIGNPHTQKTDDLMRAMGRAVETLGGRYITAEDSGSGVADMKLIASETSYVVGIPTTSDTGLGGDPSPYTAYGVYIGMKAAARRRYGSDSLTGKRVVVQGLGAVGRYLCQHLVKEGAVVFGADVNADSIKRAEEMASGISIIAPEAVYGFEAEIYAPCAMGATLNDDTIPQMGFDIIAGAANNQMATPKHHDDVAGADMLYVPDYVLNAGGVIAAAYEYFFRTNRNPFTYDLNRERLMTHVDGIAKTLDNTFNIADAKGMTPGVAADFMAEAIFLGESVANPKRQANG
ncbi:MAG: amino acid dehydrogenase [Alphaproteobacteria bacterium]|nr:amino acid dehydrogenase [Alphaproteobacteria bacterium]